MMQSPRVATLGWLAATGLALVAAAPVDATAATGTPPGFCADRTGVTVIVDFTELGGHVQAGCARFTPGLSGMEALKRAGFTVRSPTDYPGTVICRINDQPADDPCTRMPAEDHFWGYWHAGDGGPWKFSQFGAAAGHLRPGSFEGWRFHDGRGHADGPTVKPMREVSGSQGQSGAQGGEQPQVTAVQPGDEAGDSQHGPVGTLVAVGVLAVAGTGAGVAAWRRKRA